MGSDRPVSIDKMKILNLSLLTPDCPSAILRSNAEICQKVELQKVGIFLYLNFNEAPLEVALTPPLPPKNGFQCIRPLGRSYDRA